jgi:ubiquinone/menaquinone biosynthesis C-methylase UbiE
MQNSQFYNLLSLHYDDMIKFENSLQNKVKSLRNFIEPNYKTALDLGCGTGVDSIALSKIGLKVDAIDHSEEMIIHAKNNSQKYDAQINFNVSDLTNINFTKKYDFILSLGNTLANINFYGVSKIISLVTKNLTPNGKIIIQIINFSNIPRNQEFILNKFENEKLKIVRKYNFINNDINFVIDIHDKLKNKTKSIITKMFPHASDDFKKIALHNSLNINSYSSLLKNSFNKQSKDLVVCFTK